MSTFWLSELICSNLDAKFDITVQNCHWSCEFRQGCQISASIWVRLTLTPIGTDLVTFNISFQYILFANPSVVLLLSCLTQFGIIDFSTIASPSDLLHIKVWVAIKYEDVVDYVHLLINNAASYIVDLLIYNIFNDFVDIS